MAKLQGYVRSVSVNPKKISEGSHVYWDGCPSKVKLWYVRQVDPNGYTIISPNIISPRGQTPHIDDLKTLIIEYVTENGDVRVGDIWTSLCYGYRNNISYRVVTKIDKRGVVYHKDIPLCNICTTSSMFWRSIPLKYSQWEYAIKNKEVDSDQSIDFEIKLNPQPIGKIIPPKGTWEEIIDRQANDYGENYYFLVQYLKENYSVPKRLK